MPEMFQVFDVDTDRPIRKSRWSNPRHALAHGYAYGDQYPARDFVVRGEHGQPVPASWIRAWEPPVPPGEPLEPEQGRKLSDNPSAIAKREKYRALRQSALDRATSWDADRRAAQ